MLLTLGRHCLHAQDDYSVRVFTKDDSLAQNYVNSIIQDTRGFLWVGTGQGLSRYDGKSIVNFRKADGLANDFITSSVSDDKGNLYFGHLNGNVSVYTGFSFVKIETGEESKISALDFDPRTHTVWGMCQNGKLLRIKQNKSTTLSPKITRDKVINCLKVENGKLLIGNSEGIIVLQPGSGNSIQSEKTIEELDYINVTSLEKGKSNDFYWAATEDNGIYKIKNGRAQKFPVNTLEKQHISCLLEDDQNNLWVGTRLSGLMNLSLDKKTERLLGQVSLNRDGSFPSPSVLFEDREKSIWTGSLGEGLKQYLPNPFTFYDLQKLVGANEVGPGLPISNSEYWIGTNKGIVQAVYHEDIKEFSWQNHPVKLLQSLLAVTMFRHPGDSMIWIGDRNKSVFAYNIKTSVLTTVVGIEKGILNYAERDHTGNEWVSIEGHGVYQLDNHFQIVKHLNTSNGLLHNSISTVCADRNQNVWFGSQATGLFRLVPSGSFEYWTKDGLFPSYIINDIEEDRHGNIWVATDGDGLYKIGSDSIRVYKEENGLLSGFAKQLVCDCQENIWVTHRAGLSRLSTANKNAILTFGPTNGFGNLTEENKLFFEDESGDVWFSQGSRLVRYNVELDDPNYSKRVVFFSKIRLFYKNQDLEPFKIKERENSYALFSMELPFDQNHITFDFVAISLRNNNNIYYKYKLEGYEKEWSPHTQQNSITYTNLSPGNYSILVSASDTPYTWNGQVARYDFRIAKPYWQRLWFYSIEVSTLLILFIITYFISRKDSGSKSNWFVKILVYVFIFIVSESIMVYIGPFFDGIQNGAPVFQVLINLCLALTLLPLEELLRKHFYKGRTKETL